MEEVLKLDAKAFADKIKELDVGAGFDFATCCDDFKSSKNGIGESDLTDWFAVQRISMFGQELVLIAEYGGGYSGTARVGENLCEEIEWFFKAICTDEVYVVDGEKQEDCFYQTRLLCLFKGLYKMRRKRYHSVLIRT